MLYFILHPKKAIKQFIVNTIIEWHTQIYEGKGDKL